MCFFTQGSHNGISALSVAATTTPIATLYYIRPVIDELIAEPPELDYLSYIRYKLATVAPDFLAAGDHQLP